MVIVVLVEGGNIGKEVRMHDKEVGGNDGKVVRWYWWKEVI